MILLRVVVLVSLVFYSGAVQAPPDEPDELFNPMVLLAEEDFTEEDREEIRAFADDDAADNDDDEIFGDPLLYLAVGIWLVGHVLTALILMQRQRNEREFDRAFEEKLLTAYQEAKALEAPSVQLSTSAEATAEEGAPEEKE
ncbi:unnamed protein product, partial [Mesorhabditis spiculigera]